MNIFFIEPTVQEIAKSLVDKHVVKMPTETIQMLAWVKDKVFPDLPYEIKKNNDTFKASKTHINHPSTVWISQSKANYAWAILLTKYMYLEHNFRYNTIPYHQYNTVPYLIDAIEKYTNSTIENLALKADPSNTIARAIKKELYPDLLTDNFTNLEAYREFYRRDKQEFAIWTKRNKPNWFN